MTPHDEFTPMGLFACSEDEVFHCCEGDARPARSLSLKTGFYFYYIPPLHYVILVTPPPCNEIVLVTKPSLPKCAVNFVLYSSPYLLVISVLKPIKYTYI
jgi:hypothetical protein